MKRELEYIDKDFDKRLESSDFVRWIKRSLRMDTNLERMLQDRVFVHGNTLGKDWLAIRTTAEHEMARRKGHIILPKTGLPKRPERPN
jgi:hypothetical protein